MPDHAFADRRLASLYDLAETGRDDLEHYERIVEELDAQVVMDLGCGTGTLACSLATAGRDVIGVDPARASLELAQAKPAAQSVNWIHGEAAAAASELEPHTVDLTVMTGNVAQVFVTDDAWSTMLANVRSVTRPGGYLVFEVRDPAYRGWEEWTKDQSHGFINSPTYGCVETWVDLVQVALPLVTFRWTYRFERDNSEMHSQSTLIFRERDEIESSLAAAGYAVIDVRDAPDRPNKEFVFVNRFR